MKKTYRLVHYSPMDPMKCFNNFVQYAGKARREGDEIPNACVVAESTCRQLLWLRDYRSEPTYT